MPTTIIIDSDIYCTSLLVRRHIFAEGHDFYRRLLMATLTTFKGLFTSSSKCCS